jgi:hypothetical protein
MKKYFGQRHALIFLFLLVLSTGCVNLKTVGEFAGFSTVSIRNFEQIEYSFYQYCVDRCRDEAIRKYEIRRAEECTCTLYQEADSVTQVIYNSIEGYFEGLGNLSQNELTDYSSDALVSALSAKELGPMRIEEQTVAAFSSLSNILLRATTDSYRRKKLASYIEEANKPMQVLLDKFKLIVGTNLKGELRFKKERLYVRYMDMKMNNTLLSDYEKGEATSNYYQTLDEIQRTEMVLEVFAISLDEIAQGHQVLYDNRNKLSVKTLKGIMQGYAGNVKDLISEFNKLND